MIATSIMVDRSASVVLEHILLPPNTPLQIMPYLDIKQVILVGCWYLWWTRRRITHNEAYPPPERWRLSVLAIASNFQRSNTKNMSTPEHKWTRPEPKFVNVNVDAAFFADDGARATAAIIRDERGTFLAGYCRYIPFNLQRMRLPLK